MTVWDIDQQQTDEWARARLGRPTASGFSRIVDAKGNKTRESTWAKYARDLTAEAVAPASQNWQGNYHTRRGNELEPHARDEFTRLTGLPTQQVAFITREDGIAGCSPDALIADGEGNWIAGLEIKCPSREIHAEYLEYGVLPDEYKQQVHGSMTVTGLDAWYFFSFHPGLKPMLLKVERDEYTEKLSAVLDEFLTFYRARHAELLPKFKPETAS